MAFEKRCEEDGEVMRHDFQDYKRLTCKTIVLHFEMILFFIDNSDD